MSDGTIPTDLGGVRDRVVTMCDECGTTRTVARRSARARRLRCQTCGRATGHRAVDFEDDWREKLNAEVNAKPVEPLERLSQLGVRVYLVPGLDTSAYYLTEQRVLFLNSDRPVEARQRSARRIVAEIEAQR